MKKASVVHFGCSKNLVESELILGFLNQNKYTVIGNARDADVVIFNSCGFLSSARQEVRQKLLELKRLNPQAQYILYGCLPRLTHNTSTDWLECKSFETLFHYQTRDILELSRVLGETPPSSLPRWHQTPPSYAYLRISDGCSNHCSYCLIPVIRGPYNSRPKKDIIREAHDLIFNRGFREVNCISQDTAFYGKDRGDTLLSLLEELTQKKGLYWFRCLYMHPAHINLRLIEYIDSHPRIASYLDLPFQHISSSILKKMNRPYSKKKIYNLLETIRENCPEMMIRTTFMVGYPGETEKDFQELCSFLEHFGPLYAGFFTYSPEPDTHAYSLRRECPPRDVAYARMAELIHIQTNQLKKFHQSFIGKELMVLINGHIQGVRPRSVGRTYFQAPEVDSVVQVLHHHPVGSVIRVKITSADAWKLNGRCVEE